MLTSLELTGRARSHVQENPDLGCVIHRDAGAALRELRAAARADGIELEIVSAFRPFERQLTIWNEKYLGIRPLLDRHGNPLDASRLDERARVEAILVWSALPGASRHHWGTDIDVIDRSAVEASYRPRLTRSEFAAGGPFERLDAWLAGHAERFGFFRPYTSDRGGVQPEPWHLSYAPIAVPALAALTVELLAETIASSAMQGREQVLARLEEVYERYVRSVDSPRPGFSPTTRPA